MVILYDPDFHDSILEKVRDEMSSVVEQVFTGFDLDEATCKYYGWLSHSDT